jgi:hypothetical protein
VATDARAPDYIEPLRAWRSWLVVASEEGLRLSSVVHRTLWPVRCELVAVCRRRHLPRWLRGEHEHACPAPGCQCGIYGARDIEQVLAYLEATPGEARAGRLLGRVLGRVLLWGEVIECNLGWRASHAYPERIYLRSATRGSRGARQSGSPAPLAAYAVPVELHAGKTLAELAEVLAEQPRAA